MIRVLFCFVPRQSGPGVWAVVGRIVGGNVVCAGHVGRVVVTGVKGLRGVCLDVWRWCELVGCWIKLCRRSVCGGKRRTRGNRFVIVSCRGVSGSLLKAKDASLRWWSFSARRRSRRLETSWAATPAAPASAAAPARLRLLLPLRLECFPCLRSGLEAELEESCRWCRPRPAERLRDRCRSSTEVE